MAEFNYTEYIKNNPLLQEEVKDKLLTESQEVSEEAPSSKTTVSALKAQIKEFILNSLSEEPVTEEEEEDVEVDIEGEIEADAEPSMEPEMGATPEVGLSKDEQEIQDSLKLAYDNAVAIGDDKLADQIGNSITFFTRTHVVER
jgi:hypothetical protein